MEMQKKITILTILTLLLCGAACGGASSANAGDSRTAAAPSPANAEAEREPETSRGAPDRAARAIPNLAGTYELDGYRAGGAGPVNEMIVEEKGRGRLAVFFDATYVYQANGAETFHAASGGGQLTLADNVARGEIVEEGRGDGGKCRLTITFALGQADVRAAADCRFNVSIDGVYKKRKTAAKKAEPEKYVARVEFARLADYVNQFEDRRAGAEFVVEDVPMIKKIEDNEDASPAFKGLYWLSANGENHVADNFFASEKLVRQLRPYLDSEVGHLRIECVLIEVSGAGEVYRTPYAARIEAIDAAGNVLWTIDGGRPKRVKIEY